NSTSCIAVAPALGPQFGKGYGCFKRRPGGRSKDHSCNPDTTIGVIVETAKLANRLTLAAVSVNKVLTLRVDVIHCCCSLCCYSIIPCAGPKSSGRGDFIGGYNEKPIIVTTVRVGQTLKVDKVGFT